MKIVLNTTNLKQGGALQIASSVLDQFKKWNENAYHVFLSPQLVDIVEKATFPDNFHFYNFTLNPTSSIFNALTFSERLTKLERKIKPDFVLTVFGPAIWKPRAPHLVGFANGLFLFDQSRFIQKIWLNSYLKRTWYYLRRTLILKQVKNEATLIWTETEHSRQALSNTLNFPAKNIYVITNTYDERYEHVNASPASKIRKNIKFLYLTADYPHKNLDIFNDLIPLLESKNIDCSFYLTLPQQIFEERFPKYIESHRLKNLGPLTPEQCVEAYQKVDALFFPSFIETFSANYPEAMIMQRPIVTSDLDFAHDICGDAALYFDPFDAITAAAAIELLINDPALQQNLIEKGLKRLQNFDTAAGRAEKLLNIMEDYLNKNS